MAVNTLRVRVGDQWYTVEVGDLTQSPIEVTVEGETFYVEVEGLVPPMPPRSRHGRPDTIGDPAAPPTQVPAAPSSASDNIIRSPMPGRVMSILVRPGDQVSADQEVCVVEAMKMEQSIRAPRSGVIKEIHVQPLDTVNANDPLIELE